MQLHEASRRADKQEKLTGSRAQTRMNVALGVKCIQVAPECAHTVQPLLFYSLLLRTVYSCVRILFYFKF